MRIAATLSGRELVMLAGNRLARVRVPAGGADRVGAAAKTGATGQAARPETRSVPRQELAVVIERLGPLAMWPTPADEGWETADGVEFGIPVQPDAIIGTGLNFLPHAADLHASPTQLPTLFFKGRHTVIGPGEVIPLPGMSQRVTAEAELGLVIGRHMYRVSPDEALDCVAGGCCVLDQTAEDILWMNPRMLTVSKNFPGFFSFGPEIVSLDELSASSPDGLAGVSVSTCLNGQRMRSATLADMRFGLAELLAFISHVMPLECGDVVSTGTPGAVVLKPGDVVACEISGMRTLANGVAQADL